MLKCQKLCRINYKSNNALHFPQHVKVDRENSLVKLPKIDDDIRFIQHRPLPDDAMIKNVYVKKEVDKFYIVFQVELPNSESKPLKIFNSVDDVNLAKFLGLDLGVKNHFTTSDGLSVDGNKKYKDSQVKIETLNQALSKAKKGSHNRAKILKKLQKLHRYIKNFRRNFIHQLTHRLVVENQDNYDGFVLEDLNILNMTKSKQALTEKEKENYKFSLNSKASLNASILDQSWGMFVSILTYKAEEQGLYVIKVDPAYTSQICSCCGHKESKNRLSQSKFCCQFCGYEANADVNAAINIANRGKEKLKFEFQHLDKNVVKVRKDTELLENSFANNKTIQ